MAGNTIKGLTVKIGGDATELGKALDGVSKKSKSLSSELGQINKLLKMDPGNADLLAQKQKVLAEAVENTAKKLKTLQDAEKDVQKQFERGEASEEQVRALQREIIATTKKLSSYEKAAAETAEAINKLGDEADDAQDGTKKVEKGADDAADSLDDLADSADKAGDAGDGMGSKLANAAKVGLAALATATTAVIGALIASAEASREYRAEMGKLDTAFTTAGHSSEAAYNTYKSLQGVLGETDQAVEAANHLAKLAENEEQLATWTNIATGVYATFGASLPIEGLTEAANETAKTGALTGGLADALNWAGVNEESFQASLDACSTEQERQALIMETLNGLYSDAATKYRETNAEIIRANEANEAWAASMAGIGGAIDPILTDVKMLGASLLADLVPGVQKVAEAFRGLINGEEGAGGNLGAAIAGIFEQIGSAISNVLPKIVSAVAQMAPQLLASGMSIIFNIAEGIVSNLPAMAQGAMNAITSFVSYFQANLPIVLARGAELIGKLGEGIQSNLPSLVSQALDAILRFAQTIYENAPTIIETGFKLLSNLVQGIMNSLPELISKVPVIISTFANTINDNFPIILAKGVQLIGQIIKGIIQAIPTLVANIPKIITAIVDVWEAFNWLSLGKKAITLLKNGITSMVGAIKSAGTSVMDACTTAIQNLPSKLMSLGKSAISNLGSAIRSGLGTVKSAATNILNGVVNTIKTLPSKMLSIGSDLVKGLWNGISNMTGWIIGKIQSFGDSVLSGIKNFFGIASPSKVMADQVGKWLPAGMAEGIDDNEDTAIDSMRTMADDMMIEADALNGLTLERRLNTTFSNPAAAAESGILGKLDRILAAIQAGQVLTIDGEQFVGATVGRYDSKLGQRRALAARGAV